MFINSIEKFEKLKLRDQIYGNQVMRRTTNIKTKKNNSEKLMNIKAYFMNRCILSYI